VAVVPVEGVPPTTLAGFRTSDGSAAGGASTVMFAVRVAPGVPVIVTGVSWATGRVVMSNVTKPRPPGTVNVAGTRAAAVLLLESVTTAPPGGAERPRLTIESPTCPARMAGS
jgi:hypothetical protein